MAAAAAAAAALTATAVAGAPTALSRPLDATGAAGLPHGAGPAAKLKLPGQRTRRLAEGRPAKPVHTARVHPAPRRADVQVPAKASPRGPGKASAAKPHQAAMAHAQPAASQQHAAAAQQHPYQFYDSVLPGAIPAGSVGAVYADGPFATAPGQVSRLGSTMWIDVTGQNYSASVLDVEPSDATPSQAANWVQHRLNANHNAIARIYTSIGEWSATEAAIATLPSWMRARVHWWIADPTGVPHMVPGADATQWYWGSSYDLSTANPGF